VVQWRTTALANLKVALALDPAGEAYLYYLVLVSHFDCQYCCSVLWLIDLLLLAWAGWRHRCGC
jgi:hypothetical protein